MQWNTQSDPVRSIEFYRMFVQSNLGKMQVYQGAIVFGQPRDHGCEVLKILTPTPNPQELYDSLSKLHSSRLRERLVFLEWDRSEVISAVQGFCQQGLPLPEVFDETVARLEGLTVFQLACYQQTCRIPHGETRSYAWLAERLKKFGAERAVGGAMKSNPFPLLIPCHRVVKKDGNLGGFMGATCPESWQLGLKKTLLEIEGLHQQPSLFSMPIEALQLRLQ
ncbi:MAG: methylated-DNA--[protein]-cysteine S-methyltransferase [Bdellovibrionota bacterium]